MLGPSFIILALGLGSGEVILWPYMASNYGLGIAWGAILGITFQYFINMEIERYALVKGESVFVGLHKLFKPVVYWFIFSTFLGFGIPGIIAASAKVFSVILGVESFKWIAIGLLLLIGLILSVGRTVYGLMEKITKVTILLGVPFIFILTLIITSKNDWFALLAGMIGRGDGYWFFPHDVHLATFLAAFAYAGAGGNLNLTQSIYIKEKGYGMGKYSQRMVGLFHSKKREQVDLEGKDCEMTKSNLTQFKSWWKLVSLEHLLVFLFLGALSIILLMMLAFSTTHGLSGNVEGINFVINEGMILGQRFIPIFGNLFLLIVVILLFQTQLGVMDSTSRIMAENFAIKKLEKKKEHEKINLTNIYYGFVWAQIVFGIVLFLFNISEPKFLLVLGAVINAFAMFVHIGLVFWLNNKSLPRQVRPGWIRKIIISIIFLFFGGFSLYVILNQIGVV